MFLFVTLKKQNIKELEIRLRVEHGLIPDSFKLNMKHKIIIISLAAGVILFAGAFLFQMQKNLFLKKQIMALETQGDQRRALWNSVQIEAGVLDGFVSDILLAQKENPLSVRGKI